MGKSVAAFVRWAREPRPQVQLNHSGEIESIDVYGDAVIEWRGAEVTLPLKATRYRSTAGLDKTWRVTVAHVPYDVNLSDIAMRAIYAVIDAPMLAYIGSDGWNAHIQHATFSAIRSTLREERYSTDGTRRLIVRQAANLTTEQAETLTTAADHLDAFHALLKV